MKVIDAGRAEALLNELFAVASEISRSGGMRNIDKSASDAGDVLFRSLSQSFREVLLGCGIARLLDRTINIRHPYVNHGEGAFNGRTLDERVINPFFHNNRIPSSKGPYLAIFRRSVKLDTTFRQGVRDKDAYDAMLTYLSLLEKANATRVRKLVLYLLCKFIELRDASDIPLARIARLSLDQVNEVVGALLGTPSGGRLPVMLTVAMLRTISDCYSISWTIVHQGINVSDKASGAGADITITSEGNTLMALEVTERPIAESRVVSTFNTKIVESGIGDYIFVHSKAGPDDGARQAARRYFPQGHEINFVNISDWIVNNLATIGSACRAKFIANVIDLLSVPGVPGGVKVAWNDAVKGALSN